MKSKSTRASSSSPLSAKHLCESSQEIAFLLNSKGKIEEVSSFTCEILEYPRTHMIGRQIESFLAGDRKTLDLPKRDEKNPLKGHEYTFATRSKKQISTLLVILDLSGKTGRGGKYLVLAADVRGVQEHERLILNRRIQDISSKMTDRLAQTANEIAHAINTPLGVITMGIHQISDDLLEIQKNEDSDLRDSLQLIQKAADKIALTIKNVKLLGRYTDNDSPQKTGLAQLLRDVTSLVEESYKNLGIRVSVVISDETLSVVGRPSEIFQDLHHLLLFAESGAKESGEKRVQVYLREFGDFVEVNLLSSMKAEQLAKEMAEAARMEGEFGMIKRRLEKSGGSAILSSKGGSLEVSFFFPKRASYESRRGATRGKKDLESVIVGYHFPDQVFQLLKRHCNDFGVHFMDASLHRGEGVLGVFYYSREFKSGSDGDRSSVAKLIQSNRPFRLFCTSDEGIAPDLLPYFRKVGSYEGAWLDYVKEFIKSFIPRRFDELILFSINTVQKQLFPSVKSSWDLVDGNPISFDYSEIVTCDVITAQSILKAKLYFGAGSPKLRDRRAEFVNQVLGVINANLEKAGVSVKVGVPFFDTSNSLDNSTFLPSVVARGIQIPMVFQISISGDSGAFKVDFGSGEFFDPSDQIKFF